MIEPRPTPILLIGIGNEYRGDDAAGILLARSFATQTHEGVTVRELQYEAASMVELLNGWLAVIVVDTAVSGGKPGSIRHFDVSRQPLPASLLHTTTHTLGPAEAIELSRALGHLPSAVHVITIEGINFEMGGPLSDDVRRALPELEFVVSSVIQSLKTNQPEQRREQ